MHPYLRYGFLENLDTVRRLPLGRFWGVRLSVTPLIWLFPFIYFSFRLALLALGPPLPLSSLVYDAGLFTVAVALGTVVHALGHVIGGHLVHRPMDELLFTATRGVNRYTGDQSLYPASVHLARALGGPLLNLLAAALLLALAQGLAPGSLSPALIRLAGVNLFIGAGAFLPLPSVDGEVIWRELLRLLRPHR